MGSKGLKALIVDDLGTTRKQPSHPERFTEALNTYSRYLQESKQVKVFEKYGTASLVEITNAVGGLPTRNFSTGVFEKADNISGETLYNLLKSRQGQTSHRCMPGCLIRCSNVYVDEKGAEIVSPLEYETIALLGSNLEIDNLDVIAQLNYWCNDYGLDTIETGAAIGVAMAGGLIPFGDAEGALNLVHEIGKGSLVGRVLGMGAEIAGKVLGVSHRPTVKGQAISGYDPRGIKGTGVTYATSPMGADHTAGNTIRAQIRHNSSEGQVELSRKSQNTIPIYDNLGLCMFTSAALGSQLQLVCDLVNAQLGVEWDVETLLKYSSQTIQWEREFNLKAGLTNSHDRLPEFFIEEENPANHCIFDISDEELVKVH
jgi:aldehyde:ferredoxin oxidoreductase